VLNVAKTPSSNKSESVTLRIPNELFSSVLDYATAKTKGNRSEAIVELIEMGLAVAKSQQSTLTEVTLQDIVRLRQSGETVSALAEQVSQLNSLVQNTVLQRLTAMETELMGESNA
jgi:metal-responsive CopG/Arc/MetJ family transcriptional regulator